VDAPVSFAYDCWSDFAKFPDFMDDIERVEAGDGGAITWFARPGSAVGTWGGHLIEQVPGSRIAWHELCEPECGVSVTFAPLEGDATWMVMTRDFASDGVDDAGRENVSGSGPRIERDLHAAREIIEHSYVRSRSLDGAGGTGIG